LNLSVTQKLFLTGAICSASLSAIAQSPDTSAAREIAEIDGEYSDISIAKGMPAASVEYFAEDGIAFAPGAVNGKKYWAGRTDFPGTLIWQPIFAFAAGAADLGYTTGMWELKKENEPLSLGFGHYVTLWAKQPNGRWKIALDVGTENPQPPESSPGLQVLPLILRPARNHRRMRDAVCKKRNGSLPRPRATTSARLFSPAPLTTFAFIAKNHSPQSGLSRPGSC
jgi:ketosteroid isomerase-like protein